MKRHKGTLLTTALALAVLLAGCWGSEKSTSLEVTGGGSAIASATAVGIDKCHNCHADTAVGAVRIFDAWAGSRHANLDNTLNPVDNLTHGTLPNTTSATCTVCHDPDGDSVNLAMYVGPGSSATARSVIGCEGCHGGGSLHFGVGPIGGPTLATYAKPATTGQSSQYNTCIGCHQDSSPYHSETEQRITDTHFDNATRAIGSDIQGYVIRKSKDSACVDCHNPHTANLASSPNVQWHASKHGNFTGEGWKHYQWTASDRTACQRCHTTTGLINYLTNPSTYDPANNVFSWLSNPATDNRAEMLYCYGCHTNYYGGLRNPGAITATYTGVTPEPVFPDVKGSNICLACHTGRENGDSIKAKTTSNFDNVSFVNSHYLTAGATLFGVSGYEYDTLSYANVSGFKHDVIGLSTAPVAGTGSNGPCVGCHMSTPTNSWDNTQGKHRFLPTGLGITGTEIITTPVCALCHTADPMTISEFGAWEDRATAGLAVLDNVLRARGFYFASTNPYFFKTEGNTARTNAVTKWTKKSDGTFGDNTIGMKNMGAAFNYNLLAHDPGFFTHNYVYTKRLIYDSIDWLDDNQMNNSTQSYITSTFPPGTTRTDALAYFGASGRP